MKYNNKIAGIIMKMSLTVDKAELMLQDKYTPIHKVRKMLKELGEISNENAEFEEIILRLEEREKDLKKIYRQKSINYLSVQNGFLGLGARPAINKVSLLKKEGVETVVTLLKKEEKLVEELGRKIKLCEMDWEWLPLSASNLRTDVMFKNTVNSLYDNLIKKLDNGGKIFVHCAAGIHRTGAFSNGLLRKMGFSEMDAKKKIYDMRCVTAIEAIQKHWNWSEKIIS